MAIRGAIGSTAGPQKKIAKITDWTLNKLESDDKLKFYRWNSPVTSCEEYYCCEDELLTAVKERNEVRRDQYIPKKRRPERFEYEDGVYVITKSAAEITDISERELRKRRAEVRTKEHPIKGFLYHVDDLSKMPKKKPTWDGMVKRFSNGDYEATLSRLARDTLPEGGDYRKHRDLLNILAVKAAYVPERKLITKWKIDCPGRGVNKCRTAKRSDVDRVLKARSEAIENINPNGWPDFRELRDCLKTILTNRALTQIQYVLREFRDDPEVFEDVDWFLEKHQKRGTTKRHRYNPVTCIPWMIKNYGLQNDQPDWKTDHELQAMVGSSGLRELFLIQGILSEARRTGRIRWGYRVETESKRMVYPPDEAIVYIKGERISIDSQSIPALQAAEKSIPETAVPRNKKPSKKSQSAVSKQKTVQQPDSPLTELEREVLDALNGNAKIADDLEHQLSVSRHTLFKALNPLKQQGRIKNDRKVGGYYRPDAPPAL
jgi:hypothetical protein